MEQRPITDAANIVRLVALTTVRDVADGDALLAGLRDEAREVGEALLGRVAPATTMSKDARALLAALEAQRDAK